jgi:hypothetical protein
MKPRAPVLLTALVVLLGALLCAPAASVAEEATGRLHLSSRPRSRVYIDDVDHGTTDQTRRGVELAPGTYRVRFVCEHEQCEQLTRRSGVKTLTVTAGKETRYLADLFALNGVQAQRPEGVEPAESKTSEPLPDTPRTNDDFGPIPATQLRPTETTGVAVLSSRPRCAVEIDGRFVGTTDRTRMGIALEPGRHRVRFVCEEQTCSELGRRSGVKTLTVVAGQTVRYVADLEALNRR